MRRFTAEPSHPADPGADGAGTGRRPVRSALSVGSVLPVVVLVAVLGLPTFGLPTFGLGGSGGLGGHFGHFGLGGSGAVPGAGAAGAAGTVGTVGTAGGAGQGGTVADAVSAVVVAYAVLRAVRLRQRPLTGTAAVVLGLPVVGIAVAATGAADPVTGLTGLVRYLQVFVLVPAAVLLLIRDRAHLRVVAWALVGLAVLQGGLGVYQYVTGTGASYMGRDVRAVGTFGATDVMGMATVVAYGLVCAVGLALGSARAGRGRRRLSSGAWGRAVAVVCAVLLVVPLAVSFSRGAWIATAVGCGAQLALAGLRRAVRVCAVLGATAVVLAGGAAIAGVGIAGAGAGTSMLSERLGSITHVADAPDRSVVDRYTMWSAALGMWRERPVTGVGLKDFPADRDSHASLALSSGSDTEGAGAAFQRQPLLSPHDMYLLVLGEQGLLGLAGLAGSLAALLVCGVRRAVAVREGVRAAPGGRGGGAPPGLDCALVACGLLVWQLVDFVYADIGGPSTVLTAVVLGVSAWWSLGAAASGAGPSGAEAVTGSGAGAGAGRCGEAVGAPG